MKGESPTYETEFRLRCKDGSYKWVLARGRVLEKTADGEPLRVVGTHSDITERKRAESEINRLSVVLEKCPSSILITEPDGRIIYVNASFESINGYTQKEVIGKKPNVLKSGRHTAEVYKTLWSTITTGRQWRGDLMNRTKSGQHVWVRVSISPVFDKNGNITNYIGAQEDITELKKKEDELRLMATTDELTGIFNRRKFMEMAEMEFRRAKRLGQPLSLIIFDIDHFKKINDTYGHHTGDMVLISLCRVVEKGIRDIDVLGRLGGDEFGVLLPQADLEAGETVAERLRSMVEARLLEIGPEAISITISLGVGGLGWSASSIKDLINDADQAMYQAKKDGRNHVHASENRDKLIGG